VPQPTEATAREHRLQPQEARVEEVVLLTAEDRAGAGGSRFQATRFGAAHGERLLDQKVDPRLEQRERQGSVERRWDEDMGNVAHRRGEELLGRDEDGRRAADAGEPLRPLAHRVDDGGHLDAREAAERGRVGRRDVTGADQRHPAA